jgi:type IV pilus assembly protein PilV
MTTMSVRKVPRGMMLLEVLIALLIFTIGALGMVKMQALSTANSVNSEDRATAALLASDLISELWANNVGVPDGSKTATAPSDFGPGAGSWQDRVSKALPGGDGGTYTTFSGNTATIVIKWNRKLGLNVEGQSNMQTQATYQTQVIIK